MRCPHASCWSCSTIANTFWRNPRHGRHAAGRCPTLRVLATSRQPLALAGEVVRAVGPLELPPPDGEPTTLLESAAMLLFMERAQAASVDLEVTPEIAHEMATICRRLDGVPLALELAAARLRGLSMRDLAARLDSPFDLLSSGATDQPATSHCVDHRLELQPPERIAAHLARALSRVQPVAGPMEAARKLRMRCRSSDGWLDCSITRWSSSIRRNPGGAHYRMMETVSQSCSAQCRRWRSDGHAEAELTTTSVAPDAADRTGDNGLPVSAMWCIGGSRTADMRSESSSRSPARSVTACAADGGTRSFWDILRRACTRRTRARRNRR